EVLEGWLAGVRDIERHRVARVIEDCLGDAYAAWLGERLKPSRNIHAVAKDIIGLDNYVADVDADPKSDAPVLHIVGSKVVDAGLELHSSSNRFDRARKLCQEPVAGVLDNAAAVFGNCRGDSVGHERRQFGMRSLFVIVHEPRVASDVGGQYRRQPALDPDWPLLHHGPQPNRQHLLYDGSDERANGF